mgnify:FL=1
MYCIDKQAGFIYNRFMNMKSSKTWIVIFAAVLVICAAAFLLLKGSGGHGTVAVIRVDGEISKKINLDTVAVAYDMEIKTEFGYNKLHIEHDGISVTEADCRDHICMDQGKVSQAGVPIVCLPHRLTIEIEGDDIDA